MLLRHGESALNAQGRFTGLLDPHLTGAGYTEARAAAHLMAAADLRVDAVFTSTLRRTAETARTVLACLGTPGVPCTEAWELNERSYGSLTGQARAQVLQELGPSAFTAWRRSYDGAPPPMPPHQLAAIRASPAMAALPPEAVPATESLAEVAERVRRFWHARLVPALRGGGVTLVVAHGNTLRALCMVIGSLGADEVEALNIPTGQPLLYRFTEDMEPTARAGAYLDPEAAHAGAARIAAEGGT